jgi:hypothetical protein
MIHVQPADIWLQSDLPLVIVYLGPENLQLSEACKSFLVKTKDEADRGEVVKKSLSRFGGWLVLPRCSINLVSEAQLLPRKSPSAAAAYAQCKK